MRTVTLAVLISLSGRTCMTLYHSWIFLKFRPNFQTPWVFYLWSDWHHVSTRAGVEATCCKDQAAERLLSTLAARDPVPRIFDDRSMFPMICEWFCCNVEWCATIFISCIILSYFDWAFLPGQFFSEKVHHWGEVAKRVSQSQQGGIQITTHITPVVFEDQKTIGKLVNSEDMNPVCDGWIIFDGILQFLCYQPGFSSWIGWFADIPWSKYHPNLWRNAEKPKNLWKIWRSPTFAWMKRSGTQLMLWRDLVKKINSQLRLKHVFFQCAFFWVRLVGNEVSTNDPQCPFVKERSPNKCTATNGGQSSHTNTGRRKADGEW